MALYFKTSDPAKLLETFKERIDKKKIITWAYDNDGDFTHATTQWKNLAWLQPKIESGRLAFYTIPPKGKTISVETYAIYHGRFLESMLAHCDNLFTEGVGTAQVAGDDRV